jgi:hypothetical protein
VSADTRSPSRGRRWRDLAGLHRAAGGLVAAVLAFAGTAPVGAQDRSAAELRVTLTRLLGEHAFLTLDVVRTGAGVGDESAAAAAALDENTAELVAAIEDIYGGEAGDAFGELWRAHIGYVIDYARASAEGDSDAAALAAEQLDRYVADFSGLVATAIPELSQDAVTGLIREHVQQLEHVADIGASAYEEAYHSIRHTYRHMYTIGDALAHGTAARFPERFPGQAVAFGPAADIRITLDRLFGEHTYLSALAMRAAFASATDAPSASEALRENGSELTGVIADVYGATAGEAFGALWQSHIDDYLAYVEALRSGDDEEQVTALADLEDDRGQLSAFVANANPLVTRDDLEALLQEHNDLLVEQADEFAGGDYAAAYEVGRAAYLHSSHMGEALGAAIAGQFPDRFPNTAVSAPPDGEVSSGLAAILILALAVVIFQSWRRAVR